ncbi:MAG: MOP flippase family protein [Agriterribacter sp.]
MSLTVKAKAGVKWTTISAIIGALSQLLLTVILARFLDKKDFGLMAIAIFVINFSQLFIDLGISNAIIFNQNVDKKQLSTLYWMNIILGIFLFCIILIISPFVAVFYKEPQLKNIINLIGITFLIQPLGMQFSTLLRKELHFKEIAIRNIISKIIGLIMGFVFGYYGLGVYALVYSTIFTSLFDTVMFIILGRKLHTPSFYFNFREIKPFFSFGLYQMGEKFIDYFNSDVDSIIVGKLLGIEALGIYNIAKSFVLKPFQVVNPILTKVAFPIMAKVQNEIPKLKFIYLKMQNVLAFINFPVFLFMFFFAESVILLVFGQKWIEAAMPLRILSIYSMIRSTMNPIGSLQLARGKADQGFFWTLAQTFILSIPVYFGSKGGLTGVCYTLLIVQVFLFLIGWKVMVNYLCGASFSEFLSSFRMPLILSIIPAAILFPVSYYFIPSGTFNFSLLNLSIYLIILLIVHLLINRNFLKESSMLFLSK